MSTKAGLMNAKGITSKENFTDEEHLLVDQLRLASNVFKSLLIIQKVYKYSDLEMKQCLAGEKQLKAR